jgi:hypothetical protein|tara:strand:+ start:57 stop:266 length:210 start_codon:yes stop_codon:yes gene_type:complete
LLFENVEEFDGGDLEGDGTRGHWWPIRLVLHETRVRAAMLATRARGLPTDGVRVVAQSVRKITPDAADK